jgi:cytosine/adenosine deaminase-related metal-dependent hydrolase
MIITAAKLLTIAPIKCPTNNGAVAFSQGVILDAGPSSRIIRKYPSHHVFDLRSCVLLPGLINTHIHLELPSLFDKLRAKSFPDWILNLIALKKDLLPPDFHRATTENLKASLAGGTTTVGEICTHDVSPALLKQSGLRAVIFRELIHMGPESSKSEVQSSKLPRSGLVQVGMSPHSPYSVSESNLLQIGDMVRKQRLKLAMHIAESKDEIKLLQRKKSGLEKLYRFANWDLAWAPTGSSSFEYLDRIGFLSPGLLAVHAVQVDDHDINLLKKSGASVAHCPRSNMKLRVGRMPLKKFLDAGITVGLGTDSLASVPTLNMWDEMRYAYRIHRRDGISTEDILRIATVGGAKALGLDKEIGTIEPGKKADIIAVPLPKKNTGNLYNDLLRETKSCIMTMVNGKILYREGQG